MANKNSKTPRDYSKEYNPPGSKEQEERNKRKRDKRKHDKLYGECPEGTELHHTNGIENDEVECVSVSKNRGRKEKSRLKDGEIVIRIKRKNADVKKLKEGPIFGADDIGVGPSPKQKRSPRNKPLEQAKREFLQALRQTKVGAMDIRDAEKFDKRMMDVLNQAIDNKIQDIAKDYKVFGKKKLEEQEQPDLTSPDLTVAQFVDTFRSRTMKSKLQSLFGGSTAKVVTTLIGAAIGSAIPVGGTLAGAAVGGAAGIAIDKILDRLRDNLPKALMALQNMPDESSEGSAFAYFDLDDETQSLTRGGASKDGPLLKDFQKYLFSKYREKFSDLSDEDLQKPLANFIEKSASDYLNDFLKSTAKTDKGDVINRIITKT